MFEGRHFRMRRNPVSDHPTQLYLELSTYCNLACLTCVRNSVKDFRPAHFTPELMERLVDSMAGMPTLKRIVLLGYGEALCNPHIQSFLKRLKQTGVPVCLVTNGQLLTRELTDLLVGLPLQQIFISWDDVDDTAMIRLGAQTGKIKAALDELVRRRRGTVPLIGVEIVALKSNFEALPRLVATAGRAGVDRIIVTNVFPYSEAMRDQILFAYQRRPPAQNIKRHLAGHASRGKIIFARQTVRDARSCPFVEKGTLFVTAHGDIAPCLELAHTHQAWYFDSGRLHAGYTLGNIATRTLASVWESEKFSSFRDMFSSYDFPDCMGCRDSQMCLHRSNNDGDCFRNGTPCGECLWARGVIRCP